MPTLRLALLLLLPLATACSPPLPPPLPSAAPPPVVRQDALELEGVPPIPAELVERLSPYLNVRSASLADLSPDGRHLLINTRLGGDTSQLHLVEHPLGARQQLTFRREPVGAGHLLPDGDLTFTADVGGDENYQIFRLDRDSGQTTRLTDGQSRHEGYLWDHAHSRLAYASNARNGRDIDVYLSAPGGQIDPAQAEPLFVAEGAWSVRAFSHDDRTLLVAHEVSINDSRLYLVDLADQKMTRLSPPEQLASDRDALFSHDGRTLYVASDRGGEFVSLYAVSRESGAWKPLTADIPWNVEQITLSPDGQTLAFTLNIDGVSTLRLMDTTSHQIQVVADTPPGQIQGLRFASAAPVLGFTLESATSSGDVWTLSLADQTFTRWTHSELGGLRPETFVTPSLVRFPSFDGREIPAFYYRPPGEGPHPVLIRIHGGPEAQARLNFSAENQHLLHELGVAVLVPNVRGSNGYGRTYLQLDDGRRREDAVRDIGALLDWIALQPELDAARVAVSGGSYGGYMVLAALTHYPQRIRAGIDVVGISNFVTFLEGTSPYRRDLRRVEYGDERDPEMRAFLQEISPTSRTSQLQSALFVAHGANDPRVPLGEARQIAEAARANGAEVWLMVAHDEGHGFRKQANREQFTALSALFLQQHLLAP